MNVELPQQQPLQPRLLPRVPNSMKEGNVGLYLPSVVTLGAPAAQPESLDVLQQPLVQRMKDDFVDRICLVGGEDRRPQIRDRIRQHMQQIRDFYGGLQDQDEEVITEDMLTKVCTLVCMLEQSNEVSRIILHRIGLGGLVFSMRDMFMLENQIPLFLITFVAENHRVLLREHLSAQVYGDNSLVDLPWADELESMPFHYLEAAYLVYVSRLPGLNQQAIGPNQQAGAPNQQAGVPNLVHDLRFRPNRSATSLVRKGIKFRRSTRCLRDIQFRPGCLSGVLELPFFCVTSDTKILFTNLIAYELSPNSYTDYCITSYVSFMKSLLETTDDVKLLREAHILSCMMANDEEVLDVFTSIETFGVYNNNLFRAVYARVRRHCASEMNTWYATFKSAYVLTPWKIVSLLAAIFVIGLYIVQTACAVLSLRK
ncbi:uncharacterized protein LOC121786497 [Salvia splendens]|uniref:uncharacterized protein LOC121786497 n=1 Tax=Salvia splendens TaxID=180675 RepID=UPI001C25A73D|nr:uncharacterized protein LOC121786497 [Salvia splendens]